MAKYCYNRNHGNPCELPCHHCERNCPHEDFEDSDLNRQRDEQWEVRKPKNRIMISRADIEKKLRDNEIRKYGGRP